jgi:hypothetical protein
MIDNDDNYIDLFDPEIADKIDALHEKEARDNEKQILGLLTRRKQAYTSVFTAGNRSQEDIDYVLNDLIWFCKVYVPAYDISEGVHANELSKRKEGRREVFLRILDFAKLKTETLFLKKTETLFLKYTNSTIKR